MGVGNGGARRLHRHGLGGRRPFVAGVVQDAGAEDGRRTHRQVGVGGEHGRTADQQSRGEARLPGSANEPLLSKSASSVTVAGLEMPLRSEAVTVTFGRRSYVWLITDTDTVGGVVSSVKVNGAEGSERPAANSARAVTRYFASGARAESVYVHRPWASEVTAPWRAGDPPSARWR